MGPEKLGPRLEAEREYRGLTLEHVSAATKIPLALLDALERDDLSRWPKGLYRRAFFRAYVTTLGLRPEPLAAEFARLFPDQPMAASIAAAPRVDAAAAARIDAVGALSAAPVVAPAEAPPKRNVPAALALTLARSPRARYRVRRHTLIALIEIAAIAALGALAARVLETTVLTASGTLALLYYPLMNAIAGRARRPWNVAHAEGAARRLVVTVTPSPARRSAMRAGIRNAGHAVLATVGSGFFIIGAALAAIGAHVARRWVPAVARLSRATSRTILGAAGATGHVAWRAVRGAQRAATRAAGAAALTFWRVVGTVSEHAYLLASRRLDRTKE